MIDWRKLDKRSPLAWTALADQLIAKSQFFISAESVDQGGVDEAIRDMSEFVQNANTICPVEAIEAVRRASNQLTKAQAAAAIADLATRSARLDAISARLSSASNELKADAARLRLEPVRKALGAASTALAKVKEVEASVANLSKNDIAGRATEIAKVLESLIKELESAAT
ncbi:MAG: hypothetical protein KF757_11025 [Phycisphaeraceae bacterium]|nr:hypothetical protein [Phycisphaeraceae bacterium]MCW5762222.1 hypothetical protein [Phycisphaeraceae bacterium]